MGKSSVSGVSDVNDNWKIGVDMKTLCSYQPNLPKYQPYQFGKLTPLEDLSDPVLRPCAGSLIYNLPALSTKPVEMVRYELLCVDIISAYQKIRRNAIKRNKLFSKKSETGLFNAFEAPTEHLLTAGQLFNMIERSYCGYGDIWKEDIPHNENTKQNDCYTYESDDAYESDSNHSIHSDDFIDI